MNPTLTVTTPSDREIVLTREFAAPRDLVWEAYTTPALVRRWLGAFPGWHMDVCDIDLRVGGRYRYLWRGPDGAAMGLRGTFREVAAPDRIVTDETYDEAWYEGQCLVTVVLRERAGRTTLTMTLRYDTRAIRDAVLESPMRTGVSASFDALAEVLRARTQA